MARPERKTVDYFPHYLSDGKKMFFIEHKHGNNGYATWFKILESLASTDNHYLNLNDNTNLMFLSAKCKVEENLLIDIINDLVKLGELNDYLWESKVIYSQKFVDSIQDAYSRRNNKCMTFEGLCKHLLSFGITKTPLKAKKEDSNTQSIVYNNKVDNITPPTPKGESDVLKFLTWFNEQCEKRNGKLGMFRALSTLTEKNLKKLKLAHSDLNEWNKAFYAMSKSEWVIETKNCTPDHFLRVNNFTKYLNQFEAVHKEVKEESEPKKFRAPWA
jgi:hypothetical protein